MFTKTRRLTLAAAVLLAFAAAAQAEIAYTVTDLGAGNFFPTGVNNLGHVAGRISSSGYFWDGSSLQAMSASWPGGVNDLDQVVVSGGYWDGTVHSVSGFSANDINNSGLLAGAHNSVASVYDLGTGLFNDLGALPGNTNSTAKLVNASGQVAGWSWTTWGTFRSFLYTPGSGMVEVGFLPGGNSTMVYGMNASGVVVGGAKDADGHGHPFLYTAGSGMVALPSNVGSYVIADAMDVDASGVVVAGGTAPGGDVHGFVYRGGAWTDLNSLIDPALGITISNVFVTSDVGHVACWGTVGGVNHAYLLAPVPEPSTVVLLACGLMGLAVYAWRRRRV